MYFVVISWMPDNETYFNKMIYSSFVIILRCETIGELRQHYFSLKWIKHVTDFFLLGIWETESFQ